MMDERHYGNIAPGWLRFAAQAAEVEVDTETGAGARRRDLHQRRLRQGAQPVGHPRPDPGAAVQAIGWTLYEQLQFDGGRLQNGGFADYCMPGAESVPRIGCGLVESDEPNGPTALGGASETAIVPGAAAIANAVADAIGIRFTSLPITPEKVLAALDAARAEAGDG